MNTHDTPTNDHAQPGKRRLLLAIGGGSIGLSQWIKPAINTVLTPAHAQTSGLSVTFTTSTGVTAGNNGSIPTAVGVPVGITANVVPAGSYNYEWTVKSPTGAVIADFGGDQSPGATLTYTQVAGGVIIEVLVDNAAGASGSGTLNLTVGGFVPRPGGGSPTPTQTTPEPLSVTLIDPFARPAKSKTGELVMFSTVVSGGSGNYGYVWTVDDASLEDAFQPTFEHTPAGAAGTNVKIKVTVNDTANTSLAEVSAEITFELTADIEAIQVVTFVDDSITIKAVSDENLPFTASSALPGNSAINFKFKVDDIPSGGEVFASIYRKFNATSDIISGSWANVQDTSSGDQAYLGVLPTSATFENNGTTNISIKLTDTHNDTEITLRFRNNHVNFAGQTFNDCKNNSTDGYSNGNGSQNGEWVFYRLRLSSTKDPETGITKDSPATTGVTGKTRVCVRGSQ